MKRVALLLALALLAVPASGCLGFLKKDDAAAAIDQNQLRAEALLGEEARESLSDLASAVPKAYAFPGQTALPTVRLGLNNTVGMDVTFSYEGNQDQGGTAYNLVVKAEDVSKYVPPGQPVEIFVKLRWNAKEVNSADLDIYVDVPGTKTSYYPAKSEDFNWNVPTKTLTINTVGVAGLPHLIGVEASSGKTLSDVPYELVIEFNYPKDVLTPYLPWAFHVPANASGVIIESEKVAGDEHIRSEFIVIGPDDSLVGYVTFNDLAIPTESVFVPTKGPGQYVFYAFYMHGGFLRMRADAGLERLEVQPLARVETVTSLDTAPSPGMVARDWVHNSALAGAVPATEMTGQKEATFSLDGPHPLDVTAWIKNTGTLGTQVRISSSKGLVHDVQRVLRYDDERGSVGYSSDHTINNVRLYENLVKGAYKVEYVNNGQAEVGYTVVTYQR